MKKREVQDLIYNALAPIVLNSGFRLKKSKWGFFRTIPGGWQCIGIPFWDYKLTFEFSLVMTVRLDEVEEITNKFNAAPAKYHSETVTAIFQLDRFMEKKATVFRVTNEDGIQTAISRLTPVIQERIIPFLDENRDLKNLAIAMNLTEIRKIVPGVANVMKPVTVARLIGSPEFHSIVEGYKERLSKLPKSELEIFQNLVQYLEKYDGNSDSNSILK